MENKGAINMENTGVYERCLEFVEIFYERPTHSKRAKRLYQDIVLEFSLRGVPVTAIQYENLQLIDALEPSRGVGVDVVYNHIRFRVIWYQLKSYIDEV